MDDNTVGESWSSGGSAKVRAMAATARESEHILRRDDGVPVIAGTTTKVIEVVAEQKALGWDAAEIERQHPHLSRAQIEAALVYYRNHARELDQDMERRRRRVAALRRATGQAPLTRRLGTTRPR
jgi:uncharacterized protein (DUF433 family)